MKKLLRERPQLPWVIRAFLFAIVCGILAGLTSGCSLVPNRGTIKAGDVKVQGVKDAGSPTTLNTTNVGTTLPIPANSTIEVTKTDPVPAQPATADAPAQPAQPAKVVTKIIPSAPTILQHTEATVQANTGTIDTSVRKHEIDVADRRIFIWIAVVCGIAGLVVRSLLPAWPGISNGLLIASPCAFAAWKFAEVPSWLWFAIIAVVVLLALGYKRAQWDKDGDGIPDILQKKPPTS